MKKIGKLGYIAIGSLFTLILGSSFYSFAQTSNQPSSSSQTDANLFEGNPTAINVQKQTITLFNGTMKKDFTINPDTIIYRNGQKTTLDQIQSSDKVKMILNSEQVVRYVEATGTQTANSSSTTASPTPNHVQAQAPSTTTPVNQLQLHIDFGNGNNYDIDYHKNKEGKVDSHIQKKIKNKHMEAKDQQAAAYIESLIQQLGLTPNSNQAEILSKVQSVLGVKDFKKLEFKVKFSNEQEIHINLDSKDSKGHEDEDED